MKKIKINPDIVQQKAKKENASPVDKTPVGRFLLVATLIFKVF